MKKNKQSIGIFDSGLGGLTVLKKLKEKMSKEHFIYFGDTAHVPYGNKSKKTIIKYSKAITQFLVQKKVKLIIVACNTASSTALESIKKTTQIPIIDVITPAVNEACSIQNKQNIGIIGTDATIQSKAYQKQIKKINNKIKIYSQACPLFVPIIEEGLFNHNIAHQAAEMYLKKLNNKIDILILGCTHYPIMINTIKKTINKKITIIDSATATARFVKQFIKRKNIQNTTTDNKNKDLYYVNDKVVRFNKISQMFLNNPMNKIHQIKL